MMTKKVFLLILLLPISHLYATPIHFISSLEEAKRLAKEQNKLIFVDVMADWCGPCKQMMKDIEGEESLVNFMNGNFINLKVNEKSNKNFIIQFEIKAFPTIGFLDFNGTVIEMIRGYSGIRFLINKLEFYNSKKDLFNKRSYSPNEEFNEQEFINEVTHRIAISTPNLLKSYIQNILKKGDPHMNVLLHNFPNTIDYETFLQYYQKMSGNSDQLLTEKLLLCFLYDGNNFQNNHIIQKSSKDLAKTTGMEPKKILAFLFAQRELNIHTTTGNTSPENQLIFSKILLTTYPETQDLQLLHDAFTHVLTSEENITFYNNIESEISTLAEQSAHYLHNDILSIIHFKQGNKDAAAKDISQANDKAHKQNMEYVPLYKKYKDVLVGH